MTAIRARIADALQKAHYRILSGSTHVLDDPGDVLGRHAVVVAWHSPSSI
jgi:hypothetical protein